MPGAVREGSVRATPGRARGSGSNHHSDAPPCIPTEPLVRESVQAHRDRMETKRLALRPGQAIAAAGRHSTYAAATAGDAARHESPQFVPDPDPEPAPAQRTAVTRTPSAPRPARARPATARSNRDVQRRLAAVTAYVSGDTLATVAERLGVGQGTVHRWLHDAGVEMRKPGKPRPTIKLAPDQVAALVDGYTAGATLAELATEHHLSPHVVSRRLAAAGVAMRPARPRAAADRPPQPTSTTAPAPDPAVDREGAPAVPDIEDRMVTAALAAAASGVRALSRAATGVAVRWAAVQDARGLAVEHHLARVHAHTDALLAVLDPNGRTTP